MQSNDLNILTSSWDLEDLKNPNSLISNVKITNCSDFGRGRRAWADVEQLKSKKVPVTPELLLEVRKTVAYYENLGKSRRWIRRYIKRKFNITEY